MAVLVFTGQQSTADTDMLLSAMIDGRSVGVRITSEVIADYGQHAAMNKAIEKAQLEKFEPNSGIRVTTADFA